MPALSCHKGLTTLAIILVQHNMLFLRAYTFWHLQVFPWADVIGATQETSSGVRICYCTSESSGAGVNSKVTRKLQKSGV